MLLEMILFCYLKVLIVSQPNWIGFFRHWGEYQCYRNINTCSYMYLPGLHTKAGFGTRSILHREPIYIYTYTYGLRTNIGYSTQPLSCWHWSYTSPTSRSAMRKSCYRVEISGSGPLLSSQMRRTVYWTSGPNH